MCNGVRCLILLLALADYASATPQAPDVLLWNGDRHKLYSHPLEVFLRNSPDKRPKSEIISTGLWRGYVATWEIVEYELRLIELVVLDGASSTLGKKSVFAETFPDQDAVVASWYSGDLMLHKDFHYMHLYDDNFEEHTHESIVLTIEHGMLKSGELRLRRFLKDGTTTETRAPLEVEGEAR